MRWSTPIKASDSRLIAFNKELIWKVLVDVKQSELWWPAELGVKITKLTPNILGSEYSISPKGGRPFQCRIVALFPNKKILTEYLGGFIAGNGEWSLAETKNANTLVTYQINVTAHGLIVTLIGKIFSLAKLHWRLMNPLLENLEKECGRVNRLHQEDSSRKNA